MLKTTGSNKSATNLEKTKGKVGGDSMAGGIVAGGEATNFTKRKNQAKTTKSKILLKSKNHDFSKSKTEKAGMGFLTPKARLAFFQLRQAFVKPQFFIILTQKATSRLRLMYQAMPLVMYQTNYPLKLGDWGSYQNRFRPMVSSSFFF